MAAAAASRVIRKVAQSPARVIDPFIAHSYQSGRGGLMGWFRNKVRDQKETFHSSRAKGKVQSVYRDFSERTFTAETAPDLLFAFHVAHAENDDTRLKELCSEPFYRSVRAGLDESIAQLGEIRSFEVVSLLEPCQILQYRMFHEKPEAMRGVMDEPDFAQITVKLVSKVLPIRVPVKGPAAAAGGAASAASRLSDRTGQWHPVLDSTSGFVYYYNDVTKAVDWTRPPQLGSLGDRVFRMEEAGVERTRWGGVEPVGAPAQRTDRGATIEEVAALESRNGGAKAAAVAAAAETPLLRVVHHMVLERSVPDKNRGAANLAEIPWRIAFL